LAEGLLTRSRVAVTSVVNLGYRVVVVRGEDVVWNGVNVGITS
jgi:hypothetical protein